MEIYKQIRRMRLQGMSQRQIAATLQISRNTVKKYWDGDNVPWERKDYNRDASVMTESVVAFIRQCLEEDERCGTRKQHHTAKRIYDRLVEERGFTGGETTVRRLVSQLREKAQEAFVPLAFSPGDAMQIDWGEATIYLAGVKTVVNLFCARLCYSGAPLVVAYRRQNEESFLDALVHVFQYFNGIPKRVIFDNGKVAVKDGFGAHAKKQAGYAALAAHYGFEAIFCNPASGNEKGLVEGLVGYSRRNTCVPVPRVETMEELNALFREKCRKYLSHHIRGKETNVGSMLLQEQKYLYPLPGYPFDCCKRSVGRVDRFCTVRFDTNNYSVPAEYCGREVSVKASPETVSIYLEGRCIAQHERCLEKKKTVYDLTHYLPLLEKKGRAIFYAKQLKIPSFADYQEVLRHADPASGFSELLLELMKAETASRQENQNRRRLKAAGFPYLKTMEEFDTAQLSDTVSPVFLQELGSCQFVQNKQNVIMIGNPGRGKTHLAIALGLKACTQGYNVLFKNAATLSTELCEAKDNYHLGKLERTLARADLLILDELSYLSFNRHQSELLFKVISDRSEKSSTIVTTNLPFSKWTELFENTTMVAALIDRLTFRSHVLDMI